MANPMSFMDLPLEIIRMIIYHTPPRYVPVWRAINRQLRDDIDHTPTGTLGAQKSIANSMNRLRDEVAKYANYDLTAVDENGTPTAFVDALFNFIHIKNKYDESPSRWDPWTWIFVAHWANYATNWQIDPPHTFGPGGMTVHVPAMQAWESDMVDLLEAMQRFLLRHTYQRGHRSFINNARMQQLLRLPSAKLMHRAVGRFVARRGGISRPVVNPPIRPFLGHLFHSYPTKDFRLFRDFRMLNGSMINHLVNAFGVPAFPASAPVTYCIESNWAARRIMNTLFNGQPLQSLVERAALMEELFIA